MVNLIQTALFQKIQYFIPRILLSNVTWGDIVIACQNIHYDLDTPDSNFWRDWANAWKQIGLEYQHKAEKASALNHTDTALDYYLSASSAFHWAEFMYFDSPDDKQAARYWVTDNYLHATLYMKDKPLLMTIPYEGMEITGYYYSSPTDKNAPCILLLNGLDSAKEVELHTFARYLRDRGFSTFMFDGPGQGINLGSNAMAIDFENVVHAVLTHLISHNKKLSGRFGVFGVSYGGYLAMRSASAHQDHIRACVNLSGGFDVDNYRDFSARIQSDFRYVFMANQQDMATIAEKKLNLRECIPYEHPLLCIHGDSDAIFPANNCDKAIAWAKSSVDCKIYANEAHVCQNYFNDYLPFMADWFATKVL
jgi:pimeloyl-ACP methyl ester carboxylesterase